MESITKYDMDSIGVLVCYLEEYDVGRLTKEALDAHLWSLSLCPHTAGELGRYIFDRYKQLNGRVMVSTRTM